MILKFVKKIKHILRKSSYNNLNNVTINLNTIQELNKLYHWENDPIIVDPTFFDVQYIEDLNERRIRDAESIGVVIRNTSPKVVLEIGTSTGHGTAHIAMNAPEAKIFTINIPPEEINGKNGGKFITIALEKDKIGSYYRELNLTNITQIYADSASWKPNIGTIDVAFIDGCHDSDYVYNDTKKILPYMRKGGFILWHDFNPDLMNNYDWIDSVCTGIEWLYNDNCLKGKIFHVRDSWVGIYKVP